MSKLVRSSLHFRPIYSKLSKYDLLKYDPRGPDAAAEDGTAVDCTAEDGAAEDGTTVDCTAEDGAAEDGTAELSKKGGRYGGIT